MSKSRRRGDRHLCQQCFSRRALYRTPAGRVRADREHELCFQCRRAETNRSRGKVLALVERLIRHAREVAAAATLAKREDER